MRLVLCLFVALALALAPQREVAAQDPASQIEAVIVDQIEAFKRNDVGQAFTHASPNIQAMFGTPSRFGSMVESGYPMIWRPSRYETRGLKPLGEGFVQTMLFEDAQGQLFEADYIMELTDGRWRINGVYLRRLPGAVS
ncbi:MAG: DUF4864 domain-containing protein [Pseudomonadota bacterium]